MPPSRETSSATTRLVFAYVREHLGEEGVRRVVAAADASFSVEQLSEPAQWISYDTRIRLFEEATAAVGRPNAMFEVGASALRNGLSPTLTTVLRRLGSPRQVYRTLPRAVGKFSTTSAMQVLDLGSEHASLRYQLKQGYQHSRLDCLYAQGLFSVIPTAFGLPEARILHEECESDGYPACLYTVTWARRSRWRHRVELEDPELAVLRLQLNALQSVAADLVSSDQVEEVLQRITERAASAVLAPGYLLAVHSPHGGPPWVFSAGVSRDRAAELAELMLAGGDLGPAAVVVDVVSTRRHHGRLAALNGEGQNGLADEQRMLAVYAGHAAIALDLLAAVEGSRRGEQRATALLGLSHQLARAESTTAVAEVVAAALPGIVGCTSAGVLLWGRARGELRAAAASGLGPSQHEALMSTTLRPADYPELVDLLTRRQPRTFHVDEVGPALSFLLDGLGLSICLTVPLLAGTDLLGVATASWVATDGPPGDLTEPTARLAGVADSAATALFNSRLVETIKHQSMHDDLTGLANRVLFGDRLDQALRSCPVGSGVAVLFCDLDRFKQVNDVLGHAAGDELLRQVAARLRGCLRPGDCVGRMGGDEFSVLLTKVPDLESAQEVAERIVRCFDTPFRIDGRELRVTTSVGVARHEGPEGRADRLLHASDTAMYVAKQRGRNQISCAEDLHQVMPVGPSLEQELAAAVGDGQLRLHFQPIVGLTDDGRRTVVGAEALLRWAHPRLGLLPPAAFLPIAEDSGLIVELDLWSIRAACAQARSWAQACQQATELPPLQLSVNLAGRTLVDPRLVPAVRSALTDHELEPALLCLEIVESQSLVDLPSVTTRLGELRQIGVRTALDDFGTGYSTLAWLQQLPVDRIKLDRTFTSELPSPAAQVLVKGVVALADVLGIELVAEGVETEKQLHSLQAAGCRLVQGYLLGRPEQELVRPTVPNARATNV
ncbi:MAG: bifunctional diguanylate cyclase/phosphodiesterase [Frankiales bacterium]|nr:bifunctional diguanylate cyclase/phosphodiesterase [Frankiales bacterium]